MTKSIRIKNAFFVVIASAVALLTPVDSFAKVKIVVQTLFPTGVISIGDDATVPVKEKIEAVTGGSIEIILAGPGEIVPTSDLISAVVAGDQIQGAFSGGTVTSFTWDEMYAESFPFGFEADEYNSWLYEGGGIALQNEKLADEGLVAFPAFSLPFSASGWFKEPLPQTSAAFIGMYQNNPLKYRLFGLGGEVFERVMGGAVARVPGVPGVSVLENLINGDLDAAEFFGPAADEQAFFSEPGMPALYYYITAWHCPTGIVQLYLNKDVYYSLTDLQRIQLQTALREQTAASLARIMKLNGEALKRLQDIHGVTVLETPEKILDDLRAATIEILNEKADGDPDFKDVLLHVRDFVQTQQEAWKKANVNPKDRFDYDGWQP